MEKININIDKDLDLLTAYFRDTSDYQYDHLEVIDGPMDGHILFHINPANNDLVMIQIYDFSVIKKELFRKAMFLITKDTIRYWLKTLADSFRANHPHESYAT